MESHSRYLEGGDNAGDGIDHVDEQLDYVGLQYSYVPIVRLLDQHKEQDQGDDADYQKEDSTE